MKILITGSGAIGGFIGARLIEGGANVSFLVSPERKMKLVTTGLHLISPYGRFKKPVHAITPDEIKSTFDLIISTVRAHKYWDTYGVASNAFSPETVLLPLVEGVDHFYEPVDAEPGQRLIGAVVEGRISLDADGILHQRPPQARLRIGALNSADAAVAADLSLRLAGRGLQISLSSSIKAEAWERFSFLAAAVATGAVMQRPFRDAVRLGSFDHFTSMLKECTEIGIRVGFEPSRLRVRRYDNAFVLQGEPVLPPAPLADGGCAADEAAYLLAEMVGFGRHHNVDAPALYRAWQKIMIGKILPGQLANSR